MIASSREKIMSQASSKTKAEKRSISYLNYICVLFFLSYGMLSLDASSVSYISDVIMKELGISVSQYSVLSSSIWCTKAFSSIALGILADRLGKRKILLGPLLIVAGVLSILTSLSNDFALILTYRLLCGFCIGASLSMMVSIVKKNLVKNDFGARSGFVSCGSALISSTLGPIVLAFIVLSFYWRGSFVFTGSTLLALGILIQLTVKEVSYPVKINAGKQMGFFTSFRRLLANRTFVLCLLIGIFETAGKMSITIFGPVYLTDVCLASTEQKGTILSVMGLVYIPMSLIVPMLADRYKPSMVMALTFVCSAFAPLSMALFPGTHISIVLLMLLGNLAASTVSLFIYVIPSKVLPAELTGTANGIIMGLSVFFGGFICPILFGRILSVGGGFGTVSLICVGSFVICVILSMMIGDLKEN